MLIGGGPVAPNMNSTDSIFDELHAIREQLLAESGGTLAGLVASLKDEQNKSGRTIIKNRRANDCTEVDDQPHTDGTSIPSNR